MNLFDTTQLVLERAMSGATLRHSALAANLANANTPGYRPIDVDFHGVLRDALERGPAAVERAPLAPAVQSTAIMRADGNGVDVDVTAAEIAENGLELSAITKVAGARLDILRLAIGVR
jgi:flagellar basal-body rod protein FlgB